MFNTEEGFGLSDDNINTLLQDKAIGGDSAKLQGYYDYIGLQSLPDWECMQQVCRKRDFFGNVGWYMSSKPMDQMQ